MKKSKYSLVKCMAGSVTAMALLAGVPAASAANVSLIADDGFGTSSFNTGLNWSDGLAPSAGNDYFTGNFRVRTPADGGSYTFGGDSLTVNNLNGYSWGLMYKGTGNAGTITIANLIMDGGMVSHANGTGDIFNLYGGMTIASGGAQLYAKQGPMNIYSDISGNGTITVVNPDSDLLDKLWFRSSANTFTGNVINDGRLGLTAGANWNFVVGASGVNNSISGGSNFKHMTVDCDLVLDLSGASTTLGDSWDLITTPISATYYGATFNVVGFTEVNPWSWTKPTGVGTDLFLFDENTGRLSVVPVPEPSTLALFLGGLGLLLSFRRSRKV